MIDSKLTLIKAISLIIITHKYAEYNKEIKLSPMLSAMVQVSFLIGYNVYKSKALNNLTKLTHLVEAKLHFQGRYLALSALVGLVNSFVASVFLTKSVKTTHESMLKN